MTDPLSSIDYAAFARDLSALRAEIEPEIGEADFRHLRKMERWGRLCTAAGYATAWIARIVPQLAEHPKVRRVLYPDAFTDPEQIRIRDAITETSLVVNQLEITRKQIQDLLKQNRGKDEIEKPLMDLDVMLFGTELKLVTQQDLRSDDKYFADSYKVYMNLLWLGGAVGMGAGDEAGGADYKPRDVAYDILADQLKQLADAQRG